MCHISPYRIVHWRVLLHQLPHHDVKNLIVPIDHPPHLLLVQHCHCYYHERYPSKYSYKAFRNYLPYILDMTNATSSTRPSSSSRPIVHSYGNDNVPWNRMECHIRACDAEALSCSSCCYCYVHVISMQIDQTDFVTNSYLDHVHYYPVHETWSVTCHCLVVHWMMTM